MRALTRGRLLFTPRSLPTLFLTSTGRSSGKRRTSPLPYVSEGEDLVVVATNWGRTHHPDWSANLLASSEAEVSVGGETRSVRSRLASPDEFAALWPRFVAVWEHYDAYLERSGRQPRMFVLEPV